MKTRLYVLTALFFSGLYVGLSGRVTPRLIAIAKSPLFASYIFFVPSDPLVPVFAWFFRS